MQTKQQASCICTCRGTDQNAGPCRTPGWRRRPPPLPPWCPCPPGCASVCSEVLIEKHWLGRTKRTACELYWEETSKTQNRHDVRPAIHPRHSPASQPAPPSIAISTHAHRPSTLSHWHQPMAVMAACRATGTSTPGPRPRARLGFHSDAPLPPPAVPTPLRLAWIHGGIKAQRGCMAGGGRRRALLADPATAGSNGDDRRVL